ncbi:glycosyltransferase family 4 protein [Cellulomonas marina]|uniref:D-inositol 3-phosphate glycosyltransferase n=1 Tax=Cellulomonas marina TaxID=988821 RepID=A0A1I0X597_9CELL|nr:glycosyltransferase [Cellulomonas marina]GIG28921.1 hypothetical protein Cma02nite_15210 [Cellulomonas marina]SFA95518.1 Glycosyltransferase involved in cell wall bisynthesis [Cellulomonas marina]
MTPTTRTAGPDGSGERRPRRVDRLIVHQTDLARPVPGGIDTCIRGLLRYAPRPTTFAVVGVDAGGQVPGRRLGRWERHRAGDNTVWFLPVARFDPADQVRRVPHALRLVAGLVRHLPALPASGLVQAHRVDVAAAVHLLFRRPLAYFVHTQEHGLTGSTSDSFWRGAAGLHARIEHWLIRTAASTTVFNPDFAATAARINPAARFSPTWYDPQVVRFEPAPEHPYRVVWVGRVEEPKDPLLAVSALAELVAAEPTAPWTLDLVGSGSLLPQVEAAVAALPVGTRERVRLRGRLTPQEVADTMAGSGVFLMTSHPGYEGFPRVLLEAMASGLPAVVTLGADTGQLVVDGRNGFTITDRSASGLAVALAKSRGLERADVRASVDHYGAPAVVSAVLGGAA